MRRLLTLVALVTGVLCGSADSAHSRGGRGGRGGGMGGGRGSRGGRGAGLSRGRGASSSAKKADKLQGAEERKALIEARRAALALTSREEVQEAWAAKERLANGGALSPDGNAE